MSHGITKTDRMVYAGAQPWHGLGTKLPAHCTAREALRAAGLEWSVGLHECWAYNGLLDPAYSRIEGSSAIVRLDTNAAMGVVSDDYVPFQNSELADLIDGVIGSDVAAVETAGSLHGGRRVWFALNRGQFDVGGVDCVEQYALFATGHDGKFGIRILPTSVRVVCANTFAAAGANGTTGLSIAHRGDLADAITRARDTLEGRAAQDFDGFRRTADTLANLSGHGSADLERFFRRAYWTAVATADARRARAEGAAAIESGRTDQAAKSAIVRAERAERKAADICATWQWNHDRTDGGHFMPTGVRGSAWHAANAVTHWLDHDRPARTDSARFSRNILEGDGIGQKARVLDLAYSELA